MLPTEGLKWRSKDAVLRIARWQLGICELPSGSNRQKYGEAFGLNGQPWCLMFVWWVFREAGFNLLKEGSCTAFVSAYKKVSPTQVITEDFQPGDIVFFDFDGKKAKTEHVGIVIDAQQGQVITIEGNTSSGSNANGGQVQQRTRLLKYITCAVRPNYPC